jgi:predicted ABC-type ATPase
VSAEQPTLWLIAGPNGVGKTTYAFRHVQRISGSVHFVNLDEIARGLSPLQPAAARLRAARVALNMQDAFLAQRQSFSLETTLSGLIYLGLVRRARSLGYRVYLQFFSVPDVSVCIKRVSKRVSRGGHDVPEPDIRRRYGRAYTNFFRYAAEVDEWLIWENGAKRAARVAHGLRNCVFRNGLRHTAKASGRYDSLPAMFRADLEMMSVCPSDSSRPTGL